MGPEAGPPRDAALCGTVPDEMEQWRDPERPLLSTQFCRHCQYWAHHRWGLVIDDLQRIHHNDLQRRPGDPEDWKCQADAHRANRPQDPQLCTTCGGILPPHRVAPRLVARTGA